MILEIYDLECLSNIFTYTGYRPKENKYYQYVICPWRNDSKELFKHLTSDNIIQVGFSAMLGDKNALQKFDFAGFVRCLYRLVTDQQYIAQIKQEFILNNFDKMIQGDM